MVKISIIVSKTVKIGPNLKIGVLNDVIGRKIIEIQKKNFSKYFKCHKEQKTFHGLRSENEVELA